MVYQKVYFHLFYNLACCATCSVGLEYVTEIQVIGQSPRYHCELCDSKFDHNLKFPHLVGSKHRFNVLVSKERLLRLQNGNLLGLKHDISIMFFSACKVYVIASIFFQFSLLIFASQSKNSSKNISFTGFVLP